MQRYQTKQRSALTTFFEQHPDQALSVDGIIAKLQEEQAGFYLGRSTVYRLVSELEENGIIHRFYPDSNSRCVYQYLNRQMCEAHLHMKCAQCGTLFHLGRHVSDTISGILNTDEHMTLDISETVLIGQCDRCRI
jgi:Fur family transcriptional regulator, ferric uptake regulator